MTMYCNGLYSLIDYIHIFTSNILEYTVCQIKGDTANVHYDMDKQSILHSHKYCNRFYIQKNNLNGMKVHNLSQPMTFCINGYMPIINPCSQLSKVDHSGNTSTHKQTKKIQNKICLALTE